METTIWIVGIALVVALYEVTGLEAINSQITVRSILRGGLYGSLAGVVLGPIAIIVFMSVHHSLYGTTFLGLEILAGPVIGPPVFGMLGVVVGAIRGMRVTMRAKSKADALPRAAKDPMHREWWDE